MRMLGLRLSRLWLGICASLLAASCAPLGERAQVAPPSEQQSQNTALAADPDWAAERSTRGIDNAPFLPWPPPKPTRIGDISRAFSLKGVLSRVDQQLKARLVRHGYHEVRYFAVPGGFGITTEIERLAANGMPAANRWAEGKQGGWTSLFSYLTSLISGEDAQFRLFAILVTNEEVQPAGFEVQQSDVERWRLSGLPFLSTSRGRLPVPANTKVWLLVYEFSPGREKDSMLVAAKRGKFSFARHARSLGL